MTSAADVDMVRPSLRRLKILDAVVRRGAISAAAAEMGLSQPAVTLALAKLEAEIGEHLIVRGPAGSTPTQAGLILHRRVERMLHKIEAATARLYAAPDRARVASVVRNLTEAQVRDHLAVDAAGSFRAAATRLGVAEPTLSRSVRGLENMLGEPLYTRTPMGFVTVAAGSAFASALRVALGEIDQGLDELSAMRGAAKWRLSIGCLPLMPKPLLARAIGDLIRLHPGVEVSLQEDAYGALVRLLRDGAIDLILGALRPVRNEEFKERRLFSDPYVIVAGAHHRLHGGGALADDTLAKLPWLTPWRDTPRRAALEAIFARLPSRPKVIIETSSLAMTEALLVESECVTLLAQTQVHLSRTLRMIGRADFSPARAERAVGVTRRRDWLPTRVQRDFLLLLYRHCRQMRTAGEPAPRRARRR